MSTADRVGRLEARLRPAVALPVVLDECEATAGLPGLRVIQRTADGRCWRQVDGESFLAFRKRAAAEATGGFRPARDLASIRLVVLTPRLSREAWFAAHGLVDRRT